MNKFVKAMDEWLRTQGLDQAEVSMIEALKRTAVRGEEAFRTEAFFFAKAMPVVVISAVNKARAQGECQCWPD